MYYPVGHVFPRSAPTYKPLFVSGIIYASPLEFPVTEWGWGVDFEPGSPLRLLPSQRTALTEAWLVSGDSMAPTIQSGDIVLINPSEAYSTHLPCAFQTPYGVMSKRRGVDRLGRNCLLSDNPDVPPFYELAEAVALGSIYAVYLGPRKIKRIS
ncbi:S24 family peptidase [Deinococcus ruber]|uniref:Peptidase S24/S26A/S26B/S26C domain-containing protein n=1 Tax=Deinococcus ruber TaxID=1848197 RepID=A0A918F5S9_9DEIO|nr:S24 family peptidase [Deinococcus ruber]GGR11634.1 hypothetical protein GCM10008957_25790 [Deinococcus ruber]